MSKEITWTNCAEQMPPDDASQVLVRLARTGTFMYKVAGYNLRTFFNVRHYDWTTYTEEKWKELNEPHSK